MEQICANCQHTITENFCANCGQKKFKRIDKKYIIDELQYTVLHTNKGFLYSIKKLLRNPGKTAKEYIDGNRVNHYKPILLAFILTGISTFISFKVLKLDRMIHDVYKQQNMDTGFMNDYMSFLTNYNSILMLIFIPVIAFSTKLAFRNWGHNYFEHVIMNAYIFSFYTLLNILLLFPITYLFFKDSNNLISISVYSMILLPFIMLWFFKEIYPTKNYGEITSKIILSTLISIILYTILIMAIVFIIISVLLTQGPETLEYIKSPN